MKVFELVVTDEEKEGVSAISLVDMPAIQENWVALSKENVIEFREIETKKDILLGAVLIPDMLIDRKDEDTGEKFKIYLSGETIKKVAHKYLLDQNQRSSTLQHREKIQGVTVVETWVKEHDLHDKSLMYGFNYPLNTWLVAMKVENEDIKQKVKRGEIKGFSIEGLFDFKQVKFSAEENIIEQIKKILENEN